MFFFSGFVNRIFHPNIDEGWAVFLHTTLFA